MPDRLLLVSCLKPEDTDLFSALCSVSELLAGSEGVWPPAGRERATACPHPSQAWPQDADSRPNFLPPAGSSSFQGEGLLPRLELHPSAELGAA